MKAGAVFGLAAAALLWGASPASVESPPPKPRAPVAAGQEAIAIPGPADVETALIRAINEERRAAGVGELRVSPDLAAAARDHSRTMAAASVLSHTSPDGRSPAMRLVLAGIFFSASGENVASSSSFDAGRIHEALMGSPGHRANILDPGFDTVGIGAAGSWPGLIYVTEDFIRTLAPVPEAVAAESTKGKVNALRAKARLPPLVFWPAADEFAKRLSVIESIGGSRPPFPDRFGNIRAILMSGPEPVNGETLSAEVLDAEYTHAGSGIVFCRTASRPGGAYFSSLLLASESRLDRPGAGLAADVLRGINARRSDKGLALLVMKEGVSQDARRALVRSGRSRAPMLSLMSGEFGRNILAYLTSDPGTVPESFLDRLLRRDLSFIGIGAAFDRPPEYPRGVLRVVIVLPPGTR